MEYQGSFDFFYGKESERLNFITIPKLLLKDERFKNISSEAKILYGCLLDRNSLSQKNGWVDEKNRVYVIYTVKEMQKDLCCATEKISRVLKELETIGLIFRKRNGRGKANYIYVMDYMAIYRKENGLRSPPVPDENDCCGGIGQRGKNQSGACEEWDVKNFENRKSGISKNENQEFRKSKSNKTESSKTEKENFAGNFEKRNRGDYSHKGGRQSKNAFCSFEQRDYDFEEVERFLLKSDPSSGDSS